MAHTCDQCGKPATRWVDKFSEYLCADCPAGASLTDQQWDRYVAEQLEDEYDQGAP
ncbi:MAG: hypothetical protein ETSY1_46620 (plasmid) [Candidatus Entotheonella factor]|uniref:Uncharacterized protein n=1 Tax=Entotheonella factor TaxID=1429438 RepID=W4M0X6_ENTF1|nr:MAG: hypothetical protein ETSY1_46620 [Candidatus Entotheonella factor]